MKSPGFPRCFLVAAMTASGALLPRAAESQIDFVRGSNTHGRSGRPVSFGAGAGIGPGYLGYGNTAGWRTSAFGTARFAVSHSWSALFEAGVEHAWSSVDRRFSAEALPPDQGGVSLGSATAPLSQEFRSTAVLLHGFVGYDFGRAFGLRAGPLVGYAWGTMRTDNCGNASTRGIPAGAALAPTFYLWRGLELRTQAEVAFMPLPVCAPAKGGSDWVQWRAPEVGQSPDPVVSLMLTLAYIGF